jgi:tetratricopeptide (TPR) repeat protein
MKQSRFFLRAKARWIMCRLRSLLVLILAASSALGVLFARWVSFPLSRRVSGLHFSFLTYSPGHAGNPFLSYGVLAAICILAAAWAVWRFHSKALGWFSSCLLILSVAAWLQVSLGNSSLLTELVEENSEKHLEYVFTDKYVPINTGVDPTFRGAPLTTTLSDRLQTGWYFLGFGWYLATALGLGLFLHSINRRRSARWQVLPFTGLAVAGLIIGFSLRPFLGHLAFVRGQAAEANGNLQQAAEEYRRAIDYDSWYTDHPSLYSLIGKIDGNFGRTDTPEYRIYLIQFWVTQNNLPLAIDECEKLIRAGGVPGADCRLWTARIWAAYGEQLYASRAFGPSAEASQKALLFDPSMWFASYALSRAYYQIGRYHDSIDLIQKVLPRLGDASLRANLYSNLGDAYTQLGDHPNAHAAYAASYKDDNVFNVRGLTGLAGGY